MTVTDPLLPFIYGVIAAVSRVDGSAVVAETCESAMGSVLVPGSGSVRSTQEIWAESLQPIAVEDVMPTISVKLYTAGFGFVSNFRMKPNLRTIIIV